VDGATVGAVGGTQAAQLPAHTHGLSGTSTANNGAGPYVGYVNGAPYYEEGSGAMLGYTSRSIDAYATGSAGSGISNIPPTLVANYIIKT
jgi:microcystin-dependent protein